MKRMFPSVNLTFTLVKLPRESTAIVIAIDMVMTMVMVIVIILIIIIKFKNMSRMHKPS